MAEKPILFSAPMVNAILGGRKSMTRRVISLPIASDIASINPDGTGDWVMWAPNAVTDEYSICHYPNGGGFSCPYGKPGDTLWVRETFAVNCVGGQDFLFYRADSYPDGDGAPWKPSIFMPRKYSRITLRITDVRVERLQDISEADAIAEGLTSWSNEKQPDITHYGIAIVDEVWSTDPRLVFQRLWDSINAKRGYGWDANPWVWVVSFEKT